MSSLQEDWKDWFAKAGVTADSTVDLGGLPGPRHVRYLDLIRSDDSDELLPDFVVESGGVPLVYFIRHDTLGSKRGDPRELAQLVRVLACRADARYLAVVEPGQMVVYPVLMDDALPPPMFTDTEAAGYATFRGMLSGTTAQATTNRGVRRSRKVTAQWLDGLLFQLLTDAASEIHRAVPKLTVQQVLALVGRALFFRFLVDREIVNAGDLRSVSRRATDLSAVFSNLDALIETCVWLDKTFNGDLLSLGGSNHDPRRYSELQQLLASSADTVCWHLTDIQCKAVRGQLPFEWSGIYFKHVPVDVLSQVYEDFAHQFVPELAKATSIHFTPRKLAEIVVDGAFSAVSSTTPDRARVLDPSVGGGVFLVLAFKRLIAEQWRASGERPRRSTIRHILMEQLTGLDVNRDALNVTALSLYLCALELDPDPSPLSDLKFDKLIGSILHPVDEAALDRSHAPHESPDDVLLGSLSAEVLSRYAGIFDIVVGNPPWNGFKDARKGALNYTLRQLLKNPGSPATPPASAMAARYGSPDIAFMLAASSWAKSGGAIGFAVHGRILFQAESFGLRRHLFERLRVTGVMNFAALRQDEKIWPKNDAQFALMVAVNETPDPLDSFYFISPRHEPALSDEGAFRIDPGAALPLATHEVCSHPQVLRAIYKGGLLGWDLLQRMNGDKSLMLGQQVASRGGDFRSGYQFGKEHTRVDDASHLVGLLDVQHDMAFVAAPGARLSGAPDEYFELPKLQWARSPEIYRGPLLLLRESPKADRTIRGALFAATDVAYRKGFIGLSAYNKPELAGLMDLIYVVSYSDLFLYHQLLTSPKFGVERDSSLQKDLMEFPLVREELVGSDQWKRLRTVAAELREGKVDWSDLDMLVFDLHSLSTPDRQLVRDTLEMELPFTDVSKHATAPTTAAMRDTFCGKVFSIMMPLADGLRLKELSARPIDGWVFIELSSGPRLDGDAMPASDLADLVTFAQSYWSSRVMIKLRDRVVPGLLDQKRYWPTTEARGLALDLVQSFQALDEPSFFVRDHVGASPT